MYVHRAAMSTINSNCHTDTTLGLFDCLRELVHPLCPGTALPPHPPSPTSSATLAPPLTSTTTTTASTTNGCCPDNYPIGVEGMGLQFTHHPSFIQQVGEEDWLL